MLRELLVLLLPVEDEVLPLLPPDRLRIRVLFTDGNACVWLGIMLLMVLLRSGGGPMVL